MDSAVFFLTVWSWFAHFARVNEKDLSLGMDRKRRRKEGRRTRREGGVGRSPM